MSHNWALADLSAFGVRSRRAERRVTVERGQSRRKFARRQNRWHEWAEKVIRRRAVRCPDILVAAISGWLLGSAVAAQEVVPPGGYSSNGARKPALATRPEQGAPAVTRLSAAAVKGLFTIDPTYKRASLSHVKVLGAFAIAAPSGVRLASSYNGYLPVSLAFSDGRCFLFQGEYGEGALSNARLNRTSCAFRRYIDQRRASPPEGSPLRFIDASWGLGAWADHRNGVTIVTAPPDGGTFEPFLVTRMEVSGIHAMLGSDWPGGNMTLVGRLHGKLTVVVLDFAFGQARPMVQIMRCLPPDETIPSADPSCST
jgi:hypothetical protein